MSLDTEIDPPSLSRRRLLLLGSLWLALGACDRSLRWLGRDVRLGLALGGGGARGLAHIPVLECLDRLQLRPAYIAGTSIGALVGALYAAGRNGAEIRAWVDGILGLNHDGESPQWLHALTAPELRAMLRLLDADWSGGGLLDAEPFMREYRTFLGVDRFSQLRTPLAVTAGDLHTGEQHILRRGPLLPALRASMALPGLFAPVHHQGHWLVDGGSVNPLPFDVLNNHCDISVAVDVSGEREPPGGEDQIPGYTETLLRTFHNLQKRILAEKLRQQQPDIHLRPPLSEIKVLDFTKAEQIYAGTDAAVSQLETRLGLLLSARRIGGGCQIATPAGIATSARRDG